MRARPGPGCAHGALLGGWPAGAGPLGVADRRGRQCRGVHDLRVRVVLLRLRLLLGSWGRLGGTAGEVDHRHVGGAAAAGPVLGAVPAAFPLGAVLAPAEPVAGAVLAHPPVRGEVPEVVRVTGAGGVAVARALLLLPSRRSVAFLRLGLLRLGLLRLGFTGLDLVRLGLVRLGLVRLELIRLGLIPGAAPGLADGLLVQVDLRAGGLPGVPGPAGLLHQVDLGARSPGVLAGAPSAGAGGLLHQVDLRAGRCGPGACGSCAAPIEAALGFPAQGLAQGDAVGVVPARLPFVLAGLLVLPALVSVLGPVREVGGLARGRPFLTSARTLNAGTGPAAQAAGAVLTACQAPARPVAPGDPVVAAGAAPSAPAAAAREPGAAAVSAPLSAPGGAVAAAGAAGAVEAGGAAGAVLAALVRAHPGGLPRLPTAGPAGAGPGPGAGAGRGPVRLRLDLRLAQLVLLRQQADFAVGRRRHPGDFLRYLRLAERRFGVHAAAPQRYPVFEPVTQPIGQRTRDFVFALLFSSGIPRFLVFSGVRNSFGRQIAGRVGQGWNCWQFHRGLFRGFRRDRGIGLPVGDGVPVGGDGGRGVRAPAGERDQPPVGAVVGHGTPPSWA